MTESGDRVGLGWRPELAAGIQQHRHLIDVVEVIADDWFDPPPAQVRALATLARQVPVVLHAVGLGLASAHPADEIRLRSMAQLVRQVGPLAWSEHLAFVRAGGTEIGHLAAPPRSPATIAGTLANLARAREVVGSLPWLENIATLIDPPASPLVEADWVDAILAGSGASLLLDLHNVYANAINFGRDPIADLDALPLERVACVHIAGGCWVEAEGAAQRRWLDDHRHDPPHTVLVMLAHLAAKVAQPLTVFIERDGRYPPMPVLLAQLADIREALARGRADRQDCAQAAGQAVPRAVVNSDAGVRQSARADRAASVAGYAQGYLDAAAMTPVAVSSADRLAAQRLEMLLAGVYSGAHDLADFLRDPVAAALAAGCDPRDAASFVHLDRDGLLHALRSFGFKRAAHGRILNH